MVPKRKKIAMYAAMIIITAIVVFPFLWMVLLSFKSSSEIMSNPLAMPKAFNLDNFKHALETLNNYMRTLLLYVYYLLCWNLLLHSAALS